LSFLGQAESAGSVGAKQVQGQAAQEGDVLGGVAQADEAGILAKRYVKAPLRAVLDAPTVTHGMQDAATVGGQRTDRVAFLGFHPTAILSHSLRYAAVHSSCG
jgi:hypothetical protein